MAPVKNKLQRSLPIQIYAKKLKKMNIYLAAAPPKTTVPGATVPFVSFAYYLSRSSFT